MKYIFALFFNLIAASCLFAQQGIGRTVNATNIPVVTARSADYLTKKISLTTEQATKLQLAEKNYLDARLALSTALSYEERTAAIQKLESNKTTELQKILSKQQYQQYLELKEEELKKLQARQKAKRTN